MTFQRSRTFAVFSLVMLLSCIGLPQVTHAATNVLYQFKTDNPVSTVILSQDRSTAAYVTYTPVGITGKSEVWVATGDIKKKVIDGKVDPRATARDFKVGETIISYGYEVIALTPDGRYLFFAETEIPIEITEIGFGGFPGLSSTVGNNPRFLRMLNLQTGVVSTPKIPTPNREKFANAFFSFSNATTGFVSMELKKPFGSGFSVTSALYKVNISSSGAQLTSIVKNLPKSKANSFWLSRGYVPQGSVISNNGQFVLLQVGLGNGRFEVIDLKSRKTRAVSPSFSRGVSSGISDDGQWLLTSGGNWYSLVNIKTGEVRSEHARSAAFTRAGTIMTWTTDAPFNIGDLGYGPWNVTVQEKPISSVPLGLKAYEPQKPDWSGLVLPTFKLSPPISCTWNSQFSLARIEFTMIAEGGNFYGFISSGSQSMRISRITPEDKLTFTVIDEISVPGADFTRTSGYLASYRIFLYPFNLDEVSGPVGDYRDGEVRSSITDLSPYCRK